MIKFENDIFYISAGETCYIFKVENGVPMHVYFGKRVEPEDDLSALGLSGKTPELLVFFAIIDGEKTSVRFVFSGASIVQDNEGKGKSLMVELIDEQAKLKARMYYTPHPRGGIYRRLVVENLNVGVSVEIPFVRQDVSCGDVVGATVERCNAKSGGYFAICGDEPDGAYGYLYLNADGVVMAWHNGRIASTSYENIATIVIADVEVVCSELLCVYSDLGRGGATRILHDILREDIENAYLSERSAVLFLPKIEDTETLKAAVKAAGELGFGVVALDGGKHDEAMMCALGGFCRESGLIPGLRINRDSIDEKSALYADPCKLGGDGDYSDMYTATLTNAVRAVVANNNIGYVMIDAPDDLRNCLIARGMFSIKNMLNDEFNGLRVDFGMKSEEQSKAFSVCYPLEYVRNIISPEPPESFKMRFDAASLGMLGYELNPLELSDGTKRAVRAQIFAYQDDAFTVMRGDMYGSENCRMAVSKDKSRAYAVCNAESACRVKFTGLDEHNLYNVRELDKTFSGAALVNCGIYLDQKGTYVFHIRQVADY